MANYVSITSDKSKKKAFWLCLCLGIVGAHYYYVGRFGRGLLATFTLNFMMFGWFADLVKISTGKFRDNVGNYLRE